ncbi:hypothetical protein HanIR_Chr02g0099491 [Helianthus annuus]|nr:hypothetical protein HanIR_Chr02g0099491 [Helianthus annuus]
MIETFSSQLYFITNYARTKLNNKMFKIELLNLMFDCEELQKEIKMIVFFC